ncbi:MAG: hypothetical protein HYV63_13395 [Candidatus Schekmanbacteria bacterium]|nr:hypothetical protein [Candidatus Schekmanbacteria bacterium]
MNDRGGRERDLILAPNEFAFILDETKGNINVYVGPHKTSLANTDQPVVFNGESKRFERRTLEQAIQEIAIAPEGWYLVLKNPAPGPDAHPRTGALNNLPRLDIGRKVNIPGPISFALWPGQMAKVIQGHHLRSNQYLLVRVYDEEAARTNWANAVIKTKTSSTGEASESDAAAPDVEGLPPDLALPELTLGKTLVIKGTEVSFYIPPTGIAVIPDDDGNYVREAVTLERLEYCILLDEDGNKRYIQGPAVVFPRPTETFIERQASRKFKAIELNENSGIYVKVIAPYKEGDKELKVGDELLITGREQSIYFPRPEHAMIKYGEQEIHYGIAIPAGEARYVLDRLSGTITLRRGPCIFLPDPRSQVIVRRILSPATVSLWFPGNQKAAEYNRRLMELTAGSESQEYIQEHDLARQLSAAAPAPAGALAKREKAAAPTAGTADDFMRQQRFTPPRTVVLDTRFDGAVAIDIWTGYAVMVVSKTAGRRVVLGPQTVLLEYDETLQTMELSTGTPKTDDKLFRTVYLRVLNNQVSDVVDVETRDLCRVRLRLAYRVNFEGTSEKWFDVENYVKFLTDHLRSLIRNAVKGHGIEHFHTTAAAIVRATVLGEQDAGGKRPGRAFAENGMRVYDVEVLDVALTDRTIEGLLVEAQQAAVRQAVDLAGERRTLEYTRESEGFKQEIARLKWQTREQDIALGIDEVQKDLQRRLALVAARCDIVRERHARKLAEQATFDAVHGAELRRERAAQELGIELAKERLGQRLEEIGAEVRATVEKASAVSPDLVAALQAFSDKALAERVAQTMAPLAILGGESVAAVFSRLLEGSPLGGVLAANGAGTRAEGA